MTSAAGEKFAPHQGHGAHPNRSLEAHAREDGRKSAGRRGAAHATHRHVRTERPRIGRDAGPHDRILHTGAERHEAGDRLHPHPDDAGAAARREGADAAQRHVEAGQPGRRGGDLPSDRGLEPPFHLADEAQREVQVLRGHRADAPQRADGVRGAGDLLAHPRRKAEGDEEPRPRRAAAISCGAAPGGAAPRGIPHGGATLDDPARAAMILLIDNYDSFAFNLARYLEELGETVLVRRNDAVDPGTLRGAGCSHIVISPGPCTPAEAGASVEVIRAVGAEIPILGVCLGHQCIAAAAGGRVVRAARPMHGRLSAIRHEGRDLFAGLPSPLDVTRYHSLVVDPAAPGSGLRVTAETEAGEVMAIAHDAWPVWGVQFHPEAVLTAGGHRLLRNFLALGRGARPAAEPVEAGRCPELPSAAFPR